MLEKLKTFQDAALKVTAVLALAGGAVGVMELGERYADKDTRQRVEKCMKINGIPDDKEDCIKNKTFVRMLP